MLLCMMGLGSGMLVAATASTAYGETAAPTMTGGVGMEDGLSYGTDDAHAASFAGTAFMVPADQMGNFRGLIQSSEGIQISMRFKADAMTTNYVSLLEIADSADVAAGTGKLTPPRSALGLVLQRNGTVWLQTGSYAGGTDWYKEIPGVTIMDGRFHDLVVQLSGQGMTVSVDNGKPIAYAPSGTRGTTQFMQALFGRAVDGYKDWRGNIDSIAIGGMSDGSVLANAAWPGLHGSIASVRIQRLDSAGPIRGGVFQQEMFDNSVGDATWLFGGGRETEGRFTDIGTAQNYIGRFEEYERWTKAANSFGMQRFVVNAGRSGRDAAGFAAVLPSLIDKVHPKAVVYAVGAEDYGKGHEGLDAYSRSLVTMAHAALAMRDGHGCFALQLPHMLGADQDKDVKEYAQAARDAMKQLDSQSLQRIVIVDHTTLTQNDADFLEHGMSNGVLNAEGHEMIAKQFTNAVMGTIDGYAPREGEWTIGARANTYHVQDAYAAQAQLIRDKVADTDRPLVWLFMGDSITHGAMHLHGYESIAQLFEQYIKEDLGRQDDLVVNTGVSGAVADSDAEAWRSTVRNIHERMEVYHPDIVSIQLGTNDTDATQDSYERHLEQIVNAIRATNPDAVIVMRSPTPAKNDPYRSRLRTDSGSVARMKRVADRMGCMFIDQYTQWNEELETDPTGWRADRDFGDGQLHPSAQGHLRMFRQFVGETGLDTTTTMATLAYNVPVAEMTTPAYAVTDAVSGTEASSKSPVFTEDVTGKLAVVDQMRYALGADAPASAAVDASSGVVSYTPTAVDAGMTITVPVTVTYVDGSTDDTTATFAVRTPKDPDPGDGEHGGTEHQGSSDGKQTTGADAGLAKRGADVASVTDHGKLAAKDVARRTIESPLGATGSSVAFVMVCAMLLAGAAAWLMTARHRV